MMFEHALLERARADKRRIVLPEGTEERVLRAAEVLLRRGVCDLTLLGDEDAVRKKAARPRHRRWTTRRLQIVDPADLAAARAVRRALRGAARAQGRDRASWPTTWSPT